MQRQDGLTTKFRRGVFSDDQHANLIPGLHLQLLIGFANEKKDEP
jgi:hypothetical protein